MLTIFTKDDLKVIPSKKTYDINISLINTLHEVTSESIGFKNSAFNNNLTPEPSVSTDVGNSDRVIITDVKFDDSFEFQKFVISSFM